MQVGEPCGSLLEAVFGVVEDALALFGRDGSLVCASEAFLQVVESRSPDLFDLLGSDRVAELRGSSTDGAAPFRLSMGSGDWEARARPVAVAGRHGVLLALRRPRPDVLPRLDSSPPSAPGASMNDLFGHAFGGYDVPLEGEAAFLRSEGRSVERETSSVRTIHDVRAMHTDHERNRLASVGMVAAGVAHEINNPLTYVISALDVLRESIGELSATQVADALAEAWEGATRVRQVIRDLTCFSRPDCGLSATVDVHSLLDSAANMAAHELRPRARVIKEYGALPPVLVNQSRLAQVFLNLVVNAAQSIRTGAPAENVVGLHTGTDMHGWAFVDITDTGEGIPEADLGRVFEPFFSTKVERGGTGLGLAICKATIEGLGGRIEVESSVGIGTRIRVSLPPSAHAESAVKRAIGERR